MDAMELIRRFRKHDFMNGRWWRHTEILETLYKILEDGYDVEEMKEPRFPRTAEEMKEPGFPPDNHARIRTIAVAGIAAQIAGASVTKRRAHDGRDDVTFMAPKEAAEMAAEIWIESAEAVRNMDGA
jgi:hypothetical protein